MQYVLLRVCGLERRPVGGREAEGRAEWIDKGDEGRRSMSARKNSAHVLSKT